MSEVREHIARAVEHAERGLSEAKYLDPDSPSFEYALFQAWDHLQTAAKHLDAIRREAA